MKLRKVTAIEEKAIAGGAVLKDRATKLWRSRKNIDATLSHKADKPVMTTTLPGIKEKLRATKRLLEIKLIRAALAITNGNVTDAAKLLKISRKGLQLKMKAYKMRGVE